MSSTFSTAAPPARTNLSPSCPRTSAGTPQILHVPPAYPPQLSQQAGRTSVPVCHFFLAGSLETLTGSSPERWSQGCGVISLSRTPLSEEAVSCCVCLRGALRGSTTTAVPTPEPRLTVIQAVEGKPAAGVEGPLLRHREALHLGVCFHRLLDGGVFTVQPVPAPHTAVQTGVYLEGQEIPVASWDDEATLRAPRHHDGGHVAAATPVRGTRCVAQARGNMQNTQVLLWRRAPCWTERVLAGYPALAWVLVPSKVGMSCSLYGHPPFLTALGLPTQSRVLTVHFGCGRGCG